MLDYSKSFPTSSITSTATNVTVRCVVSQHYLKKVLTKIRLLLYSLQKKKKVTGFICD